MDKDLIWIEQYVNELHVVDSEVATASDPGVVIIPETIQKEPKEKEPKEKEPKEQEPKEKEPKEKEPKEKEPNVGKISLDMSILQQRMDSVSIMKYYKDLKNDRLKTNSNISYVQSEEELFNKMNEFNDNKPWPKLDNYSKKKKINHFIDKILIQQPELDKKLITDECFEMLVNKKISKKTIEFDSNNNISTLGKYSISSS